MESCHIVFPYQFDFATSLEGVSFVDRFSYLYSLTNLIDKLSVLHPFRTFNCNKATKSFSNSNIEYLSISTDGRRFCEESSSNHLPLRLHPFEYG